jgi:release factor glutamine methyltransferase
VLRQSRAWLYAHAEDAQGEDLAQRFRALVARRAAGEPVAYLTGHRPFWSLDLAVTADVLIPRPETELLVELALERLVREEETHIADLGTGSGAVALALASELPRRSPSPLRTARRSACAMSSSRVATGSRGSARARST